MSSLSLLLRLPQTLDLDFTKPTWFCGGSVVDNFDYIGGGVWNPRQKKFE